MSNNLNSQTDEGKIAILSYYCGHCGFYHPLPDEAKSAVLTMLTDARIQPAQEVEHYFLEWTEDKLRGHDCPCRCACGKEFKNEKQLNGHVTWHLSRQEKSGI